MSVYHRRVRSFEAEGGGGGQVRRGSIRRKLLEAFFFSIVKCFFFLTHSEIPSGRSLPRAFFLLEQFGRKKRKKCVSQRKRKKGKKRNFFPLFFFFEGCITAEESGKERRGRALWLGATLKERNREEGGVEEGLNATSERRRNA